MGPGRTGARRPHTHRRADTCSTPTASPERAAWIGFAIGIAVKVGIVFLMIGVFLTALFL